MIKKPVNIAITGARGRLGKELSEHFENIPLFSVKKYSRQKIIGYFGSDKILNDEILQQTDVILHLAWSSLPKSSEDHIGNEWLEDIPYLVRILQAIVKGNHTHIHSIFFSSAGAIYPKSIESKPASEVSECYPLNMYGWSKLQADQLITEFSERFALSSTILRISNVYGVGSRNNDQQGIIPYLLKAAISGSTFTIWGDGEAKKDYVFVADLIELLEKVILKGCCGLYNVSYGKSYSLNELIDIIERITGKPLKVTYAEMFKWDNPMVYIDNSKVIKELGWSAKIDVEQGIRLLLFNLQEQSLMNKIEKVE